MWLLLGLTKLIILERKDSISYIEFIRGKYSTTNTHKLLTILSLVKNKTKSKSKIIIKKNSKRKSFYISTEKIEKKLKFKLMSTREVIKRSCESLI